MPPEVGQAGLTADPRDATAAVADRIDRFVAERLTGLADRLPTPGQPIESALAVELDALDRLSRLRQQHLGRAPAKRPLLLVGLLAVTAVIVTLLVFARLRSMPVELDIDGTAVSFQVTRPVQLTTLSRLTLMQAATFAPAQVEAPIDLRALPLLPPMELRPSPSGSLTLSSLSIPRGARVTVEKSADQGTWRLGLDHPESSIAATMEGQVNVSAATLPLATIDFGRGTPLLIRPDPSGHLELDVTPLDGKSFPASGPIDVDQLSFEEMVEEPSADGLGSQRTQVSSVTGGSIFNQSLGGRETRLTKRANLEIQGIGGRISELRLEPSGLHIAVSGTVRELKVGVPGAQTTLRPSLLEWFTHHHALQMAWGSAAWLLALLLGGLRWWRTLDVD